MSKVKNLLNTRQGCLTVLELIGSQHQKALWLCQCDCGNQIKRTTAALRKNTILHCIKCRVKNNHYAWKGYKDIAATHWSRIEIQAKERNILFDLSIEDAWTQYELQNRRCALSGVPIVFGISRQFTASLDRIDSNKGYTKDNIQWVHKTINRMKGSLPDDELKQWAYLIVK